MTQQTPKGTTSYPLNFVHEVYIDRDLGDAESFREEISIIRNADKGDIVHIFINCLGGDLYTANAVTSAMRQCKAHCITEIVGVCASAATLIFLEGHEFRVNNHIEWMQHTASYSYGGKSNNVAEYVNFQQKSIRNLLETSYKHFLTKDEINDLIRGDDFWMDSEEVLRRLAVRRDLLQLEEDTEPSEKEIRAMSHEQLLSFMLDENYDESEWDTEDTAESVEKEVLGEGQNHRAVALRKLEQCDGWNLVDEITYATFDGYCISSEGLLTQDNGVYGIIHVANKPDQVNLSVKMIKTIAGKLGVEFSPKASGTKVASLIIKFMKEVVDILNS